MISLNDKIESKIRNNLVNNDCDPELASNPLEVIWFKYLLWAAMSVSKSPSLLDMKFDKSDQEHSKT